MARRVLVPLVLLASACGGGMAGGSNGVQATTCPIPIAVAAPQFRRDILPALQASCGSLATSCHGTPPTGHVSYATSMTRTASDVHADLLKPPASAPASFPALVVPNDVPHSWLVEKVTKDAPGAPGNYGSRMPQSAPNLCAETVATIESWINLGALDN
ncbi:MAG TPA: hypothetical protein VLD85_14795 [Anaeromyxobacteraceae bacterium]|nr:hypothetical protein [Anaeromyxobacteraceae bacterium]